MDCSQESEAMNDLLLDHVTQGCKREPTDEENRLTKLLLEKILPPFSKSLSLQALVVYQADQEKMKCLLVDKKYERHTDASLVNQIDSLANGFEPGTTVLSDSGFTDISAPFPHNAGLTIDGDHADQNESTPLGSSRKRKLSRPCKIPQSSLLPGEEPTVVSEGADPKMIKLTTPASIQSQLHAATATAPSHGDVVAMGQNGISDGVLLPVSAMTLLPRVNVFSLPVTVLSTLPRPILPRIAVDRPVSSVSFLPISVPPPVTSTSVLSNDSSPKFELSKKHMTSVDNINAFNRRYGKSFICNQCRKEFASLSLLCTHTFSVHRGFRCTICRAQFTQRSNLQRHSLRHVGFKPFVCKICDKAYYRKDHLVRHIELTHPGCDPRTSLTVKLSSADCLDYLEKMQKNTSGAEQVQLLCQTITQTEYQTSNSNNNNAEETTISGEPAESKNNEDNPVNASSPPLSNGSIPESCAKRVPTDCDV